MLTQRANNLFWLICIENGKHFNRSKHLHCSITNSSWFSHHRAHNSMAFFFCLFRPKWETKTFPRDTQAKMLQMGVSCSMCKLIVDCLCCSYHHFELFQINPYDQRHQAMLSHRSKLTNSTSAATAAPITTATPTIAIKITAKLLFNFENMLPARCRPNTKRM